MSANPKLSDIQKRIIYYREKINKQKKLENYVDPKYLCMCFSSTCSGKCGCEEMPKEPPSMIPSYEKKLVECLVELNLLCNQ